MTSRLAMHGRAGFEICGPIVRFCLEGPWNAERVRARHEDLRRVPEPLPQRHWGMMMIVERQAVCGPDTLAAIRAAAADETLNHRRVATAGSCGPRCPAPA